MSSLSWDGMAEHYDDFRVGDDDRLGEALDFIAEKYPPGRYSKVFEPGIGNGRIACPLAARGYTVHGMDISGEMLSILERRISERKMGGRITFSKGDVFELPFPPAAFDWAVAVHLFWFVAEWKRSVEELIRVVKPGGPIMLMTTGGGREIPEINDRYKALCSAAGHETIMPGAKTMQEVLEYLASKGRKNETIKDRWTWGQRVSAAAAVAYIKDRQLSFTRAVPDEMHAKVCSQLEDEYVSPGASRKAPESVRNEISLYISTKL